MAKIQFNFKKYEREIVNAGLDRVEKAAELITEKARSILSSKVKDRWPEHGPYKRRYAKTRQRGGLVSYPDGGSGSSWTARYHGAMAKTIRVVRKPGVDNVWIMAGNYNTWWAIQMEYGSGAWRGGRKSFMRPAMKDAEPGIRAILEGGAIGQKEL